MKKIAKHFKKNWYRYGLETLVVVIGVLVAFSLNNWNEGRKQKELEIVTLEEFTNALSQDSTLLNEAIE